MKEKYKTMKKTSLSKLINYISTAFEKIAVIRTRQALISLDDRTLSDIGYTRHQVLNGDFYNVTEIVELPAGKLGLEKSQQDNKTDEMAAA